MLTLRNRNTPTQSSQMPLRSIPRKLLQEHSINGNKNNTNHITIAKNHILLTQHLKPVTGPLMSLPHWFARFKQLQKHSNFTQHIALHHSFTFHSFISQISYNFKKSNQLHHSTCPTFTISCHQMASWYCYHQHHHHH